MCLIHVDIIDMAFGSVFGEPGPCTIIPLCTLNTGSAALHTLPLQPHIQYLAHD